MSFSGGFKEVEVKKTPESAAGKESNDKFDKLFGDNCIETKSSFGDGHEGSSEARGKKFDELVGDAPFSSRESDNSGSKIKNSGDLQSKQCYNKDTGGSKEVDYSRPSGWRAGMRDEVWENAKDTHGRVRDPVSGRYMCKEKPWDMGHKPGYEFAKHQESARERGIDRATFLNEYYQADHYRPELPESNRSHKGEDKTSAYFGD